MMRTYSHIYEFQSARRCDMNRAGMFHQIPHPLLQLQQQQQQQQMMMMMMMGGSPSFWSFNSNNSSILPASPNCHDTQQLLQPDSWSQLLLGGGYDGGEEEDRKMGRNWGDQLLVFPSTAPDVTTKHELVVSENEYLQNQLSLPKSTWSTQTTLPPALVSPSSCSSLISCKNMLLEDFSIHKPSSVATNTQPVHDGRHTYCSSTAAGAVAKKPRVQGAFSAQSSFKVRKEKLGDRITALHQIVSPFGKTDTASVLLEAIGYIRFLQSQIEALSSPYLRTGPDHQKNIMPTATSRQQPPAGESYNGDELAEAANTEMMDLRSRGLCLVPVSLILHVGNEAVSGDYLMALHGAF